MNPAGRAVAALGRFDRQCRGKLPSRAAWQHTGGPASSPLILPPQDAPRSRPRQDAPEPAAAARALLAAAEPRGTGTGGPAGSPGAGPLPQGDWRLELEGGGAGGDLGDPWGGRLAAAPPGAVPTMEAAAAGAGGGEAGLVPQLDTTLLEARRALIGYRVYTGCIGYI